MTERGSRAEYSRIEEIEKEVKRLFGNNDISMPIIDFIELVNNIPKSNTILAKKILIKRKKNDSIDA